MSSATLPQLPQRLTAELSQWFTVQQRPLPWRQERTPYRTWLSEIMLQQTQVSVVRDYFLRFTEAFPDVTALASAEQDAVLALWSGLGYYSRGRNLHQAAQHMVRAHGGELPSTLAELRALPGVGPYTAGAIASLAFGLRTPVLDGNVSRVLSRLTDDATPVDSTEGKKRQWALADELVQAAADPAQLNEGLMELGALVCTPKAPGCERCPWRADCRARKAGTVAARPQKRPKAKRKKLRLACAVVVNDAHIWLERDEGAGLFAGLHAPPAKALAGRGSVKRAVAELLAERGLAVPSRLGPICSVERTLTHRALTLSAIVVRAPADLSDARWRSLSSLHTVGLSSAVCALLAAAWPQCTPHLPQRRAAPTR